MVLAYLFPRLTLCEDESPENMDLTYRLVQYIMEHFQEPLTLEELAKKLHVNKYYLSHTFSGPSADELPGIPEPYPPGICHAAHTHHRKAADGNMGRCRF